MPHSGDAGIAKFAVPLHQVVGSDKIPLALDQQFFAFGTVCVVAFVASYVADIHVVNALLHCQFTIAGQRGNRRGR